jgi:modulator of FtsH protease
MQAWFDFYAVIGAAAATLTGLLFVAMSMNVSAALGKGPHGSRRLAEQAFQNYLAVLMVSLLALFPDMSLLTFGRTALLVTATWTVWVLVRLYQAAAEPSVHESRLRALRGHLSTMIGFGLLVYAAVLMAWDGKDMRDTLAGACIVLLFSATEKAWGLLNRIAAVRQTE